MRRVKVKPVAERTPEERAADAERLAEMFAAQQPPGTRYTERAYLEDRHNGKQFEKTPWIGDRYRKIAERFGVSTVGKVYDPGLARKNFPGDPLAWVSDTSDVKKRCEALGKSVTGAVEYQSPEQPRPESVEMAPKIVDRLVANKLLHDPDRAAKIREGRDKLDDMRAEVKERHSLKRKPRKVHFDGA